MSGNPIRVATAAISGRIFAGRPKKDGLGFKEPRYDVTGDVFAAIRDSVGVGNEIEVGLPGTAVEFRIAVLPPFTTPSQGLDAATVERVVRSAINRALRAETDPVLSFSIEHRQRERNAAVADAVAALATDPHQHGGKA